MCAFFYITQFHVEYKIILNLLILKFIYKLTHKLFHKSRELLFFFFYNILQKKLLIIQVRAARFVFDKVVLTVTVTHQQMSD